MNSPQNFQRHIKTLRSVIYRLYGRTRDSPQNLSAPVNVLASPAQIPTASTLVLENQRLPSQESFLDEPNRSVREKR